jgi:site-specific recombinase XerD
MWTRHLRVANRAPRTLTAYCYAASQLLQFIGASTPIDQIGRSDHEALLASLQARAWKPSSVSAVYRPLRTFWRFVVEHDDLPVAKDPMNGMRAPALPEQTIEFLSDAELRAVLATCVPRSRHNFRGRRDEAIIRLLASTGARLSEVANLVLDDVDPSFEVVQVLGKGRRPRLLPLDEAIAAALRTYLTRERTRHPSARSTDRLWLGPRGPMTSSGIAQLFAERGRAAGIARRLHPHELRHRFVATALGAGLSEGDVMSLTGHRSRSMLDRYGRLTRSQRAHDAFRRATAGGLIPKL